MTGNLISVDRATGMWDELRVTFVRLDFVIQNIIEYRAWEPLGYESFTAAWRDRMSGIRLQAGVDSHVVYQMISDGLDDREISEAVGGVGSGITPDGAAGFRRQKESGVPAEYAVRGYRRKPPSKPSILHLEFATTEFAMFEAKAVRVGLDMKKFAADAVRKAFEGL